MSFTRTGAAIEIIGRDVEEALDLPGMKIERQHAVGAGGGDHVGDELGRDRRARARFAVLPGIAVIGDDRGDPPRRAALQRVERDQQLHQIVVGRIGGRLDHEDILAAHVLVDLDEHFHVGKAPHAGFGQRQVEIAEIASASGRLLLQARIFMTVTTACAAGLAPAASFASYCNTPRLVWQPSAQDLPVRLRCAAGDELHDAVLRRDGDHVGDIAPGAVEHAGRDVVFLSDRADLDAVLAAQMPDDLDVLLARLRLRDGDIGVEDEVGLGLRSVTIARSCVLQDLR